MSEAKALAGGLVYLNEKQSKEAAEIVLHTMQELRREMDKCNGATPYFLQCAETIAELAKSLQAVKSIFWGTEEVEENA